MIISNIRDQLPNGSCVALFDLQFDITVSGRIGPTKCNLSNIRLLKSKKGHHFIGLPSFKEGDAFKPYFTLSNEDQQILLQEVLLELNDMGYG